MTQNPDKLLYTIGIRQDSKGLYAELSGESEYVLVEGNEPTSLLKALITAVHTKGWPKPIQEDSS